MYAEFSGICKHGRAVQFPPYILNLLKPPTRRVRANGVDRAWAQVVGLVESRAEREATGRPQESVPSKVGAGRLTQES